MIKETLEKMRALEASLLGLETRKRMLEKERDELREQVLDLSLVEDEEGYPAPYLYRYSYSLDGATAVVSIDEGFYDTPRGHQSRVKIEFIPCLDGMGLLP